MSVVIKSFGQDTECSDVVELKKSLLSKYKNMSVSIIHWNESGTRNIVLVDVQSDGSLVGTHSEKAIELTSFNF